MPDSDSNSMAQQIAARKQQLATARSRAATLLAEGATGSQVTSFLSECMDRFLVDCIERVLLTVVGEQIGSFWNRCAVVAVGGTGRRELAPYSDVDLLFLSEKNDENFSEVAAAVVRDLWDYGVKLGHTVQTAPEAAAMVRDEIPFATSLVSARSLLGDANFVTSFRSKVLRSVIRRRQMDFIRACVHSREEERQQSGQAVKQLEPDVKRAPGGLRDVHLMQWIGFAVAEVADLKDFKLRELLPQKDATRLQDAYDFLTKIRLNLHLHAGRPHDVFTREDQLRIAAERCIEPDPGRRPVEKLMQTYFRHSTNIAQISHQFARRQQPRTIRSRVLRPLTSHRFDRIFLMSNDGIDVVGRHKKSVCADLDSVLKLFLASLLYGTNLTPELLERIRESVPTYPKELSVTSGKMFRKLLRSPGDLGRVLRSMYATGVLEHLIPHFAHTRGLIQFNHYHSYTVDEHTLRAIEAAVAFSTDEGKVGSAYRAVKHKASLHLAILLHDVGKGHERDHSELGAEIANEVGPRFTMSPHKQDMVSFLVLNHLKMSHLALRRDISDIGLIVDFARLIGTPEKLRMLYVLTAADITAVGPDAFTDWKAELLGEFYSRTMEIVSGTSGKHLEQERIQTARERVSREVRELSEEPVDDEWLQRELDSMPIFYLTEETPNRVARDLLRLREVSEEGILVWGNYDENKRVVEYRVITKGETANGCFYRIAGTLTALRMEVRSAAICTTRDGVVIDAFRVSDNDFEGEVPQNRIDEVSESIRKVLAKEITVDQMLQKRSRYVPANNNDVSELEQRVAIDNDCSRHHTVIDVFAYDRPGLLYSLARALHELGLSVRLARIGTHVDQVVDVFYVTDLKGERVTDKEKTDQIVKGLLRVIANSEEFDDPS